MNKASITKKREKLPIASIKVKLIIGFIIPLICVVITGMVSYSLAASGMSENYEDSMSKAMSMAVEYVDFGFESAVAESERLYYNTDLVRWATGAIYSEYTRAEIKENVTVDLGITQKGNEFLADMYIIPESGLTLISTNENQTDIDGFYNDLENSADEAACLESLQGNWIGRHSYIDEVLSQYDANYSSDEYICSYVRPMTTRRACIVVDYGTETMAEILRSLDLGDDSLSAFVTADGRELLLYGSEIATDGDFSFLEQSYFTEAMADTAATIIDYVTYQNKEYLFILSKSYENGSAICAMVPVSMVNAGANTIWRITVIIVILSCLIALAVGGFITVGINSTINHINAKLKIVAGGDLTVSMNTERRDEFKGLVKGIVDMVKNSGDLITQVLKTAENVSVSTSKLSEASETLASSSEQIAVAVDEIDMGMNSQAGESQNCLNQMDELSQRITRAVDTVKKMGTITDNTKDVITNSITTMDDLANKSVATTEITKSVTDNIRKLGDSLSAVEAFVETINGIAEETSLLALNASIEAARAGAAGRGFAVVAQSVSSLSDGTIEAAKQIKNVMAGIKACADSTVSVSSQAEEIVSKQSDTVNDTIQVFGSINEYLEGIIQEIASLEKTIESMERHRNDTLSAIENISAASEETASSVSTVNDSLKNQTGIIENLQNSTMELEQRAKELTEAVNAFTI